MKTHYLLGRNEELLVRMAKEAKNKLSENFKSNLIDYVCVVFNLIYCWQLNDIEEQSLVNAPKQLGCLKIEERVVLVKRSV